jgi:hypothetical protein
MKKFIVTYHAPVGAMEMMKNATPEQMKEGMEPWMAWAQKCGSGLVDLGTPLGNSQNVTSSGSSPSGGDVAGYSVLQAENMAVAVEMLKSHPHLGWTDGCKIEVHEAMPLPM